MTQKTLHSPKLALVALGANLDSPAGTPGDTLLAALRQLSQLPGTAIHAISRFWQTPAFPPGSGPDYVNATAQLQSELSASELLSAFHDIETMFGRIRQGARWQSRGIDIDLIALDGEVLPDAATHDAWRNLPPDQRASSAPETVILPHPRMQERGFVLVPLAEIAPGWRHPRLGLSVREMLDALPVDELAGIRPANNLTLPR